MSDKLLSLALSRRFFVLIASLTLFFFGIQSMRVLPVDAYPDIAPVQVKILLKASGMTPEEMESRVTMPVEQNLQSIANQTVIRSLSKYGLSDITIDFKEGTDIYWARAQVAQRLSEVFDQLPSDTKGGLAPITTPLGEVLMFTVESPTLTLVQKRTLLDWVINKRLRTIEGVAEANALGGAVKTYEVVPNYLAMQHFGITLETLQSTLEHNNKNDGIGRLSIGEQSLFVRTQGALDSLEAIAGLMVGQDPNGRSIRVSDIAHVRLGVLTKTGFVTKDGKEEAVQGLVLSRKGEDTSTVLKRIKAELSAIEEDLPDDVRLDIFYDRSELVSKAINTVSHALIEALVLIILVLYLFLGNAVSAFNVAIILPFAAMLTFMAMHYFGMSANLMSLGGLAIAIGILVDSAVVMVENISAALQNASRQSASKRDIVLQAAQEVAPSIITGMVIIIILFLPLLTLEGLEGKLFVPVAFSIVFALGASLFLALSLIPVISTFLLKKAPHEPPKMVLFLEKHYETLLHYVLARQKTTIALSVALALLAFGAFLNVGKTFMPTLDEGNIIIGIEKNPSIALQASLDIDLKIQQALMREVPEIRSIVARGGSDEIGLDPMGLNDTDTFLVLAPKETWRVPSTAWLLDQFREVLEDFVGIEYSFTQPIAMRVSEMLSGSRGDIVVNIYGEETQTIETLAKEIARIASGIQGSSDVYKKANEGVAYWQISFNDQAMARYSISRDALSHYLKTAIDGVHVGIIQEGLRRIDLVIKGDTPLQQGMSSVRHMRYLTPNGQSIPLETLVNFTQTLGPVQIVHENGLRKSLVQMNVEGRDLVGFIQELKSAIKSTLTLPSGYFIEYAGEYKNQQRAQEKLSYIVPLSIVLVFALLWMTFNSALQALLVLVNIPFALIGGIFGLYITGEYMSVPASVGFIALMGIAVLNGVVMIHYFNTLRPTTPKSLDVVVLGSIRRLRPVLMTATIAALGLIPMLYATGPGSEIQKPLAIVVIHGLASSTFLTLVLLPILYHRWVLKGAKTKI